MNDGETARPLGGGGDGRGPECTRGAVIKCRLTAAPLPGASCMLRGGDKGCVAPKSVVIGQLWSRTGKIG
jgi:hypothetical protein